VPRKRPPLTVEQVLAWADAHHQRTGHWPSHVAGVVAGVPGQSWAAIDQALRCGGRGLPGGDTLARLLDRHRRGGRRPRPPLRAWTPEEDELVRTLPPKEVVRRTGRTNWAVYALRHRLGLTGETPQL
jgi:hypothetical protein